MTLRATLASTQRLLRWSAWPGTALICCLQILRSPVDRRSIATAFLDLQNFRGKQTSSFGAQCREDGEEILFLHSHHQNAQPSLLIIVLQHMY